MLADRLRWALLVLVLVLGVGLAASPGAARAAEVSSCGRAGLAAGAAAVDITPRPPAGHALGEVNLGGYGFGAVRPATWVRGRLYARAFVVGCARSDGGRGVGPRAVALEEIDNQGMQVAYRDGADGLADIRAAVARRTRIPRGRIVAASNHSHAGPDLIGAWGFVPAWYRRQVRDGAVAALVRAARTARPARVRVGAARTSGLVHTQFDDPSLGSLDDPDDTLRLLRAVDRRGRAIGTLVAYAAHSTVMGSANRGVSPDWTGALAERLERDRRWGTVAVFEGTIGKTQPVRPEVPAAVAARPEMTSPQDPQDADGYRLASYAARVARVVARAGARTRALGSDRIGGRTRYVTETATNKLLFGLVTGSTPTVPRAGTPWTLQSGIGSLVGALRIGDVVVSGVPGESYPAVANRVIRAARGARAHILLGLADDQLGYHIAPESQYPVAEREAAENGNDNTLFNVSPTFGDHLTCVLLAATRANGFRLAPTPGLDCSRFSPGRPEPATR